MKAQNSSEVLYLLVLFVIVLGIPSGLCADRLLPTIAPQLQTLLFMGEAHAIVTVGQSILAGGAIQQVDVCRTVRRGTSAVFGKVTSPRWPSTHSTCLLQLAETQNKMRDF